MISVVFICHSFKTIVSFVIQAQSTLIFLLGWNMDDESPIIYYQQSICNRCRQFCESNKLIVEPHSFRYALGDPEFLVAGMPTPWEGSNRILLHNFLKKKSSIMWRILVQWSVNTKTSHDAQFNSGVNLLKVLLDFPNKGPRFNYRFRYQSQNVVPVLPFRIFTSNWGQLQRMVTIRKLDRTNRCISTQNNWGEHLLKVVLTHMCLSCCVLVVTQYQIIRQTIVVRYN